MDNQSNKVRQVSVDSADRVADDTYDPHIIPAETAARKEREGDLYKTHPTENRDENAATNDQTNDDSVHTTDGYTVDKEGLLNNYAIEPEMYYEVPGDAAQKEEEVHAERAEELHDINQDSAGDLSMDGDRRGKGQGII